LEGDKERLQANLARREDARILMTTEPLIQFFATDHLPDHLAEVAVPFCELAHRIVLKLPRNPERTTALRKLLEAKDCAVRARIWGLDIAG